MLLCGFCLLLSSFFVFKIEKLCFVSLRTWTWFSSLSSCFSSLLILFIAFAPLYSTWYPDLVAGSISGLWFSHFFIRNKRHAFLSYCLSGSSLFLANIFSSSLRNPLALPAFPFPPPLPTLELRSIRFCHKFRRSSIYLRFKSYFHTLTVNPSTSTHAPRRPLPAARLRTLGRRPALLVITRIIDYSITRKFLLLRRLF